MLFRRTASRLAGLAGILLLLAPSPAEAVTRDEAVALVINTLITGQSNEDHIIAYAKHTPLLAGQFVYPDIQPGPVDTVTIADSTWLIFIDDDFMAKWAHQARYAFVAANESLTVITANSWPVVDGTSIWESPLARDSVALTEDEVIFGVQNMMFEEDPPAAQGKSANLDVADAFAASLGPNDYGIIAGGTNGTDDHEGVNRSRAKFLNNPVPPGNMHGTNDMTKDAFCATFDAIALSSPVDKLFVVFCGHGITDGPNGEWALLFENGNGTVTGEELKEKIKKTKAKKVCILLYACYSGCLIPALRGAADSVEIATSSARNLKTHSWAMHHYYEVNGVDGFQQGADILRYTDWKIHYLDAFLDCYDPLLRNWTQTHAWAVAAMDSADSAKDQPQYGSHYRAVGQDLGANRIVVDEQTYWIGLPPSAPPQPIEIEFALLNLVGGGSVPFVARSVSGGAFPIFDPFAPMLGFNPALGPGSVFENVNPQPLDLDANSPDAWKYDFQSVAPPHLNPGDYSMVNWPLQGLQPNPGLFMIDTIFNPPGLQAQMFDPAGPPIPFQYCAATCEVLMAPKPPPAPQQLRVQIPGDPTNQMFDIYFNMTVSGEEPVSAMLEESPPGANLNMGPGPYEGSVQWLAGSASYDEFFAIRIVLGPPLQSEKSSPQATDYDRIEFRLVSSATCACDCHADPAPIGACDGLPSVLDVTQIINVAFRGNPAILDPNGACPYQTTDVNCTMTTDILDVTTMINVAFRGFSPGATFCNPCP